MLRERSDWRHRKPNLVAINNISADTIVSPASRKGMHLGIILEEKNGEQVAEPESTSSEWCSKAVSSDGSGKGQSGTA